MSWATADKPQIANTIHRGELWLRCPNCGDSNRHQNKAHFSINQRSGAFFCLKCNHSGLLGFKEKLQYFGFDVSTEWTDKDQTNQENFIKVYSNLLPGAGSSRKSTLTRYHYLDENLVKWDAFLFYQGFSFNPSGVLLRQSGKNKRSLFFGERGISWSQAPVSMKSEERDPLIIVEGPYDALCNRSIVMSGLASVKSLELLSGHHIILMPDGDIWKDYKLFWQFKKTLRSLLKNTRVRLEGVYYIENGLDPDEAETEDMVYFSRYELIEKLKIAKEIWT